MVFRYYHSQIASRVLRNIPHYLSNIILPAIFLQAFLFLGLHDQLSSLDLISIQAKMAAQGQDQPQASVERQAEVIPGCWIFLQDPEEKRIIAAREYLVMPLTSDRNCRSCSTKDCRGSTIRRVCRNSSWDTPV